MASALSQTLTLQDQVCDADRKRVNVQTSNANVLIGGLFDIREPGIGGIGCGLPSKGEFRPVWDNLVKDRREHSTSLCMHV